MRAHDKRHRFSTRGESGATPFRRLLKNSSLKAQGTRQKDEMTSAA
jgi:hypothetical protein